MSKPITGRKFIAELVRAGIIPDMTTDVVIRASVNNAVMIEYTVYADEKLDTVSFELPAEGK